MATRVFELLILLYSGAEMTMTSLSKFFIADMLKKQLQRGDNDDDDGAFGLYNSTTAVPVTIAALLNLSEISSATSHLGLTNFTSVDADHSGFKSGYHGTPTEEEEEEGGQEEDAELQRILAWYLTFNRIGTYLPWVMVGPIFGRWTNRLRCKPQLAFPCVLYVLSALTYVLQPYVGASLLVVVLVSTLLVGACGKHAMFTTVLCNTLADRIPPEERSARFASVLAFNYMGTCLFTIAGGALTEHIGVANTLMVSSANHFACILIIVFAIKETDEPASRSAVSSFSSSSTKFSATSSFHALERLKKIVRRCFRGGNANKESQRLCLKAKGVSSDEKETTTDDEEDFQDRGFHVSLSEMGKLRPLTNESQENAPPLTQSDRFASADDVLELSEAEQDVSVEAEDQQDDPETRRLLGVDGHEDHGGDKGKALGTRPEPGKRKVVLVVLMATSSFMQCLWASQLEIIVQIISVPPMNWPGSWYGYMFAGYYGSAGVGLLLLAPLITRLSPRSRNPDVILFTFGVVTSPVASVWMGVAASRNSDWQVFAGVMLAAMGMTANSALQAIISRCAGAEGRAEAMAAFFVVENFAKALGPLLHTVVYVVSQPSCPHLVYYVMSGEGVLLVAMAVWMNCHFGQVSGHSGL